MSRAGHRSASWARAFRRHISILLLAGLCLLSLPGVAAAYWTVTIGSDPQGSASTAALSAPATPTTITETSSTSVIVGWTDPLPQLTGALYMVTSRPGGYTCMTTVSSDTSCEVSGLAPGATYAFSITAVLDHWISPATSTSTYATLGVTPGALPDGAVGALYSATLAAIGGDGPYAWALASGSSPLPAWATLHHSTGAITGIPSTAASTSGLVFTVTDSNGIVAVSGSDTQTVVDAPTDVTVTSATDPASAGENVTFTASVSAIAPSTGNPTGAVEFLLDGGTLAGCSSQLLTGTSPDTATCTTTAPASSGSPYTISAEYLGTSNFAGSSSSGYLQNVNPAPAPPT